MMLKLKDTLLSGPNHVFYRNTETEPKRLNQTAQTLKVTEPRLDSEASCLLLYLARFLERNKVNTFKNPTGPGKKKNTVGKRGERFIFLLTKKRLH